MVEAVTTRHVPLIPDVPFLSLLLPSLCRSVVYQQNSKESATLQPFFTLQLDIQSEKIRTVQEALESLVARESVQGYTSKTKQEVRTRCTVTLILFFFFSSLPHTCILKELSIFFKCNDKKKLSDFFFFISHFLHFKNTRC